MELTKIEIGGKERPIDLTFNRDKFEKLVFNRIVNDAVGIGYDEQELDDLVDCMTTALRMGHMEENEGMPDFSTNTVAGWILAALKDGSWWKQWNKIMTKIFEDDILPPN